MAEYDKPLPIPDQETAPFWEAAKRHQLVMQQCLDCGQFRFYPRLLCPGCFSERTEWRPCSGRGTVYSYVINYRPAGPAFQADVPYVVAIVEVDEGPRLMTNVVGCPPESVRIGMPVQVVFDDVTEEITLPKFRPLDG